MFVVTTTDAHTSEVLYTTSHDYWCDALDLYKLHIARACDARRDIDARIDAVHGAYSMVCRSSMVRGGVEL